VPCLGCQMCCCWSESGERERGAGAGGVRAHPSGALSLRLLRVWMPVNVIFVGMLVTSFFRYPRNIILI